MSVDKEEIKESITVVQDELDILEKFVNNNENKKPESFSLKLYNLHVNLRPFMKLDMDSNDQMIQFNVIDLPILYRTTNKRLQNFFQVIETFKNM